VTEGAVFGGVFAREGLELFALFRMAGLAAYADRRYVIDSDVKRGMRIAVASQTVGELEMLKAVGVVAHGALGDGLAAQGKVLKMAILACDFSLMLASVALNIGGLAVVAFNAVGALQLGLRPGVKQGLFLGAHRLFSGLSRARSRLRDLGGRGWLLLNASPEGKG
jgi:hypothetical protein